MGKNDQGDFDFSIIEDNDIIITLDTLMIINNSVIQ